jgi:hypothetical protein
MSTPRNLSYLADFISAGGVLSQQNTLPTQTGNTGKYLITDGTIASWATVDALPTQTSNSGKFLTTNGTVASWASVPTTVISSAAPSSPTAGTKWLNTSTGYEYTYYVDVDSSQWIEVAQPSDNLFMILGNIDGGMPTSNYGGTQAINGGTP